MTLVLHEGGPLYNMAQLIEPANTAVFAPDFGPSAQGRAWCPGGGVPASLSSFPIRRTRQKEIKRDLKPKSLNPQWLTISLLMLIRTC